MRLTLSALCLILLGGCISKYGQDHLFSPNWDNRHAKFRGVLIDNRVGTVYRGGSSGNCIVSSLNQTTDRYTFVDQPCKGCTYWYDVDRATGKIVAADFSGTKEACSLTLN
jgi:hypothetical protein